MSSPPGRHGRHDGPESRSRRRHVVTGAVAAAVAVAAGAVSLVLLRSGSDPAPPSTRAAETRGPGSTTAAPTTYSATTPPADDVTSVPPTTSTTVTGGWQVTNEGRGRAGVDAAAIELAKAYALLPLGADAPEQCPESEMEVSYAEPDFHFTLGAFAPPLGPPPDEATTAVNGVVVCHASEYAIMGFEASWSDTQGAWTLIPVPAVD